jgi:hypothetical protein
MVWRQTCSTNRRIKKSITTNTIKEMRWIFKKYFKSDKIKKLNYQISTPVSVEISFNMRCEKTFSDQQKLRVLLPATKILREDTGRLSHWSKITPHWNLDIKRKVKGTGNVKYMANIKGFINLTFNFL